MIAHIFGKVAEKFNGTIVVDVHGVGYEVSVAAGDFEAVSLGQDAKFYTYHHVREQAEELFGFSSLAAKKLFEMLITVQGVGPKAALAVLSLGDAEQVRNAIANSDAGFVQKAAGVGKKTAERVVVDLSDKVGLPTHYGRANEPVQTELNTSDEALEALMALGYTLADATKALENVDVNLPTAQRVTMALKS
ncbi:MAG: Holliday junction branch migration protein RuvA [Candidatus Nanogingivalaceae bacterium]|jgi:holliday junction DNA helicase ruvA|nr:Holliday junction branch migration protein RuvA [Candidatus Nanogingivalaceae bacterium]